MDGGHSASMITGLMEADLHTIGTVVGIAIIAWFPLMFLIGLFSRTELKAGAKGARYWAFPLLIKPDQLTPAGLKLSAVHRGFLFGAVALWACVFALGLLFP
jgi:hypothetical protein